LPHGLAARYFANAAFEGPPEASLEYRLPGATRLDSTIAFAPVGFAWGEKPFPLWFFNDSRRFNFYKPGEPNRRRLPFSVRWDGFIRAPSAEPLTWRLETDQEATLSLLGQPIVSTTEGPPEASVTLSPGWHPISVTYAYKGQGARNLELEWERNGSFRPVPPSALMPFRPSPLQERWDQLVVTPGWVLFVLQFLVVGWILLEGLWGESKERFLTEQAAVYLMVVVLVGFGTVSLAKRGRSSDWNFLNGGDDPLTYETAARQILIERDPLNRMIPNKPFYYMVGYRYFLAGTHALLGESKAMVVLTHYILLAVACALLYYLIRILAPPGPALFAAALLFSGQAHGTVYRWATELFPTMLGLALTGAMLLALAHWERQPTLWGAAGSGVLAGLATIVRPNFLVFLPFAILWMGIALPHPRAKRWQGAAVALLAMTFTIAPVTWRNWHVSERFVLLVNSGPTMLLQGNNPPPTVDLSRTVTSRSLKISLRQSPSGELKKHTKVLRDLFNDPLAEKTQTGAIRRDTLEIQGMVNKVIHLVDVEVIDPYPLYQQWNLAPQTREVLEYLRQQPGNFIKGLGRKALQTLGFAYPFAPALLLLHLAYLLGAVLLWRAGVARRLAILLHAFVLSQWLVLVIVKPGPHLPKTQLPTFFVAFGFAALLIVSWTAAAIEGRPPPSIVPRRKKWSPRARILGGAAAMGLLGALTYLPRLPLLIALLAGAVWSLRHTPHHTALGASASPP
ncbi:glycosyltransferase family 39 protein, partial [Nitrospinae bacterium AH-259-F20]|nr:glycosyltransferase family 39 protein [Nitrospinae bacterium AH-259-F20]